MPVDSSTLLAFLYSAPLVTLSVDETASPVPLLDFQAEREVLTSALDEAGRAVQIRQESATIDNLRTLVTLGCRVIHFSGHAVPNSLLFEDGRGASQLVPKQILQQLLQACGPAKLELAFVSACHSAPAGEALVAAGVPHVVAVEREQRVYDEASRTFARAFYLALVVGKTIRQAFQIGKESVGALEEAMRPSLEKEKFVLLPIDGDHDVSLFTDVPPGAWKDISLPRMDRGIPAVPEHFVGRNPDVQRVIASVSNARLTTVRGVAGIGKTALAAAVGQYLGARRSFPDGVYWISLRATTSTEAVRFAIATVLGVITQSDGELFDVIRSRRLLFILDNCEDALNQNPLPFRHFLTRLLEQAPHCKILTTGRYAIGGAIPGVAEKVLSLGRLATEDASRLFIKLAPRELRAAELATETGQVANLIAHPVMQFLAGHPLAIALAAPLLQDRTLGELHQTLEQKRIAALEVPGLTPNEHDVSTSLSVSLGASVDHLSRRDPDAFRLFVVLGLLPAGAVAENLDVIWGESWRLPMETLIRVSLVEKRLVGKLEYYSCFPFVASFAETLLTPQDREVYPSRVAVHFAQICNDIHETISSPEHKYADALLDLLEGNFWACFDDSRLGTPPDASGETAVGRIAYLLPATLVLAGRLQDAERAAARALQACIKWGDEWGRANALQALGEIQLSLGNVSQSSRNYEAALGIYQTLGHSLGEANTLEVMGQLCQRRRDVEGAIRYYDAALRIWQSEQRQRQVASILYLRGEVHANHGSYTAARNDYDRALQIFRDEDYKLGEANVLLLSGDLKGHLGDQHGKRVAYEEALPIYVQINDELGVANCSQGLGSVKKVQKDFEGACRDLELAIKLFKKQHRPLGHANSLTELGNVYTSAMFPESAAEPLFEALKIQVDIGNSLGVAAAIAQLAFTSSALKRHEAAVLLLERVLLLESESLHSKAIALAAQASEFATIGAASSAVVCTWSAREIFYRANHPAVEQMDAALAEYKLLLGSDQFDRLVSQLPECGRELRRAAVKEVDTRAGNDPWLKTVDKALAQIE